MKRQVSSRTPVWIAVKVERGFVTEARVFTTHEKALKRKERWHKSLNPDYDEAAVIKSTVPATL